MQTAQHQPTHFHSFIIKGVTNTKTDQQGWRVFSETPVGIWKDHYEAMALRVPVKKLVSALPLTAAVEEKIMQDGIVTYLQNDGTVTTITPKEVEEKADKMNITEQSPNFLKIASGLSDVNDIDDLLKHFSNVKDELKEDTTALFSLRASELATNPDDVKAFYTAIKSASPFADAPNVKQPLLNRHKQLSQPQA